MSETNRTIEEIKEELARLQALKDNARTGTEEFGRANIRYWAIRWVMGWEKEIPEADKL